MNLFLIVWVSDMPIIDSDETYPHVSVPSSSLILPPRSLSTLHVFHGFPWSTGAWKYFGGHTAEETNCPGSHHPVAPLLGWASWVPPFVSLGFGLILCSSWYGCRHSCCCSRVGDTHHLWLPNRSAPLPQHGCAWGMYSCHPAHHRLTLVRLPALLSRCFAERRLFKDTVSSIHLCIHSWGLERIGIPCYQLR